MGTTSTHYLPQNKGLRNHMSLAQVVQWTDMHILSVPEHNGLRNHVSLAQVVQWTDMHILSVPEHNVTCTSWSSDLSTYNG
jgi:hypothetical protein